MTRSTLVLTLLLAAAPAAGQTTWDDPTLAVAVAEADLIVLAKASAVAKNGAAYVVEKTLKGPKRDGQKLAVRGLHSPELSERPPVEVGDRSYLLLRGDPQGEGFAIPTPTFGRFVRREISGQEQVVASLGGPDTFARIAVPAQRFESLLLGLTGKPVPALLASARKVLADPEGDTTEIYLALEIVTRLGAKPDASLALRVLRASRFSGRQSVRVRMAALRAFGHQGGPGAATRLLAWVETDPRPEVRSVAASMLPVALGPRPDPALKRSVSQRLARMALGMPYEPTRFGRADDPRKNFVPSPLEASLQALATLGAEAGTRPALRALERDHEASITAGLGYFDALGDPSKAEAIVRRMRPADSTDAYINRRFARTLQVLTGQEFGPDPDRWRAWCEEQKAEGPQGPGGPR